MSEYNSFIGITADVMGRGLLLALPFILIFAVLFLIFNAVLRVVIS